MTPFQEKKLKEFDEIADLPSHWDGKDEEYMMKVLKFGSLKHLLLTALSDQRQAMLACVPEEESDRCDCNNEPCTCGRFQTKKENDAWNSCRSTYFKNLEEKGV